MASFTDFLASILNPNPGVANRLVTNPDQSNHLAMTGLGPEALARYHQASGMGLGAAPQAAPQSIMGAAPAIDPVAVGATPQAAPQDPSGGGIGGFLGNLFQDPETRQRNHTVQWLQRQGLDEGTATLIAGNKPALQQYLLQRSQGQKPIEINGRLVDPNSFEVLADFSDRGEQNRPITVGKDSSIYDPASGSWITPPTSNQQEKPDFSDIAGVRKEIQGLPSYKNFAQAAPIYDTMIDASARDTKAADLNLIYGLGKIFDPNSVVREGEMVLVKDTASLPDWVIGTIQSVNGGARLQPETRIAIMKEAESRIKAYKTSLDSDFEQYTGIADRYGIKREDILPVLPSIRELPNPGSGGDTPLPLPPPPGAPVAPPAPLAVPQPQPAAPTDGVLDYRDWLAPGRKR